MKFYLFFAFVVCLFCALIAYGSVQEGSFGYAVLDILMIAYWGVVYIHTDLPEEVTM